MITQGTSSTNSTSFPIAAILSKMQMNERNVDIQEECLVELANLAYANDNNKVTIVDAGGIDMILSAMKTHSNNRNVQEYGCAALWNFAVNDENKVTNVEVGGITTILSAMKTHSYNRNVKEYDCEALMNLALNDENKVAISRRYHFDSVCNERLFLQS